MPVQLTESLLNQLIDIVWEASDVVLRLYQNHFDYSVKSDGSPLTQADLASHEIIVQKLQGLTPDIPIISEENADFEHMEWKNPRQFWLVDPLDGTKEFIHRNGEFTINVALIDEHQPVLGVVAAPALKTLYAGFKKGGAIKLDRAGNKKNIHVISPTNQGLYVVGSRSHGDQAAMEAYLVNKKVTQFIAIGSSLKFCKIAEGAAHLYPRLGRTMEWDTAAGHAILAAAGGRVERLDGRPLSYGKQGFENPHFVAKS